MALQLLTLLYWAFQIQSCYCESFVIARQEDYNLVDTKGVAQRTNDGFIALTQSSGNTRENIGRIFHIKAVQLRDPSSDKVLSFNTTFVFQIFYEPDQVPADGMTFMLSPTNDHPPSDSVGGSLGFISWGENGNRSNLVFGVEFDTYQTLQAADPPTSHVGIDINSVNSTSMYAFDDSPNSNLTLLGNLMLKAQIQYDGDLEQVKVWLVKNGSNFNQPILTENVSLKDVLTNNTYVGFSAATGVSFQQHKLYRWEFQSEDLPASPPGSPPPLRPPSPPPTSTREVNNSGLIVKVAVPLSVASVVAGAVLVYWYCCSKRKKEPQHVRQAASFTYRELYAATKGFSPREILGKGGSGEVYKGYMQSLNSYVAVKSLSGASKHAETQFIAELSVISTVRHHNLVSLRGWCQENKNLLLVYEYMANGSLDHFIFSNEPRVLLTWEQRFEILKGVAEGLAYLHGGLEKKIVHRDVKAANVLLDDKFVAKLGDFGLARLMERAKGAQTMTKAGTIGYIAPELAYTGRATEKSDVYSFGILTLEVVAGRKALNFSEEVNEGEDRQVLLDWVWELHEKEDLERAVDSRLVLEDNIQVVDSLKMALLCCLPDATHRPSMRKCCQLLAGEAELDMPKVRPRGVQIDLVFGAETSESRLFTSISSTSTSTPILSDTSEICS